jgi:hypothetical protein
MPPVLLYVIGFQIDKSFKNVILNVPGGVGALFIGG